MTLAMWEINNFGDAALISLICISIVFVVLIVIAFILSMINKIKALDVKEKVFMKDGTEVDDNMMAAILTAVIDYQKVVKEDVKVVSCKEVK